MFRQIVNIPRLYNQLIPISRNFMFNNNIRKITYYTKTHKFIDYNKENQTAKLGITYYAKNSLGEIIFIENNFEEGATVKVEDEVITIKSTKAIGVLSNPIEGEIIFL